jgi:sugar lactone lactonase YvrE
MTIEPRVTLFADGLIFGEAPRWRNGSLWLPDVFDCKLYRIDDDGRKTVVLDNLPPRPNSIAFLDDDVMLLVSSAACQVLSLKDDVLTCHADLSGVSSSHLNDFVIDEVGRLYVGDFGYDFHAGEAKRDTNLYMVDIDGSVSIAASGLEFPNGAVIIEDGRKLVVAETWRSVLTAFDRASDGTLSNMRLHADLGGRNPDGICADGEGGIWVPCFNTGEVVRVLEGGAITHRIEFEGSAVACHLGGEDGRTLFCSVYLGSVADCMASKRLGAVYTARVEVPAPAARAVLTVQT